MKIEKINDNQLKIILTQDDLVERDIKLTELAYGSEKIQSLFQEMLSEAMEMYNVDFENKPLMIEAIPTSLDSIMLIVTKITNSNSLFEQFAETAELKNKYSRENHESKISTANEKYIMYTFDSLEHVVSVSYILIEFYYGKSSLYKLKNTYYLVVDNSGADRVEFVLSEYGKKKTGGDLFKLHLEEHGECIISADAIGILFKHL